MPLRQQFSLNSPWHKRTCITLNILNWWQTQNKFRSWIWMKKSHHVARAHMHCFILTMAPVMTSWFWHLEKKCHSVTGISSAFVLYVAALVCRLIGDETVKPTHLFLAQLVLCWLFPLLHNRAQGGMCSAAFLKDTGKRVFLSVFKFHKTLAHVSPSQTAPPTS